MTEPPSGHPRVTFVMYHYVRPIGGSRFPRLPAVDVTAFDRQLEYLCAHYVPVTVGNVIAAAAGSATLPPRAIVLTFDDGYSDHYRHVFRRLHARRIAGAFFPAASSLLDRAVLAVNKIQFIVAAAPAAELLVERIDAAVRRHSGRSDLKPVGDYRADGWKKSRFDAEAVSYVKYMLQRALPADLRTVLVDGLFAELVSADERGFADELYFTPEHAREMVEAGMTFGCHADRHATLTTLDRAGQAREIDGAMRVLDPIGIPRSPFIFSYAKGAYDADSIDLLRARGCVLAVTNRPDVATITPDAMLTLPRIDANDLPAEPGAPVSAWTQRS